MKSGGITRTGHAILAGNGEEGMKEKAYTRRRLSFLRRMSAESYDLMPRGHSMTGLLEADVTSLRRRIREGKRRGESITLFACLLKAVALSLKEYPGLNSMRAGRDVVLFHQVDINFPVEMEGEDGLFPRQVILRDAANRTVGEIVREVENARLQFREEGHASASERTLHRGAGCLLLLPRFLRRWILRGAMRSPEMVRRQSGTTFVSSVTGFQRNGSFILPYDSGPRAAAFLFGGISPKVVLERGIPEEREMLSLTVILNHDLVDGAPAARFVRHLLRVLENGEMLPPV